MFEIRLLPQLFYEPFLKDLDLIWQVDFWISSYDNFTESEVPLCSEVSTKN